MGWQIALAAVGAAAGAFNAYDEFHANRQIREDLQKIKRYLVDINKKIDNLIAQNRAILDRLDELPGHIYEIVEELQNVALLRERYSVIVDIRDNYLVLRGGRVYQLDAPDWIRYREAMTYLFQWEYRPSRTFQLIEVAEIALVITKERALPLVKHRISVRRDMVTALRDNVVIELEKYLAGLRLRLDDKRYVQSHNLDENLGSLDELVIVPVSDRTRAENYTEQVCEWVEVGGRYSDRRVKRCHDVRRTRQVPDTAFHKTRDKYIAAIRADIPPAKVLVDQICELNDIIQILSHYLRMLDDRSKIDMLAFERLPLDKNSGLEEIDTLPMFFERSDEASLLKADLPVVSAGEFDEYDDYVDGCHGDCESIAGKQIEDDNPSFSSAMKSDHEPPC